MKNRQTGLREEEEEENEKKDQTFSRKDPIHCTRLML